MGQQLTSTTSFCELFHETELCPDEILVILQSLDDNSNSSIFNVVSADTPGSVTRNKNRTCNEKKKRKKPAMCTSSSSPSLRLFSDEDSDVGHDVLSKRESVKKQKGSLSLPSMENRNGEDCGDVGRNSNNGNVVSHIAVERNRRKQMNEHLTVLRQLMPCFYVKKGDQASIVGGVIDYINELHHVLQSLEAKKRRKIYTSEVGTSPRVPSSAVFLAPRHHLTPSSPSPSNRQLSPRPPINFPVTPRTPQPNSPYYKSLGQVQTSQPSSSKPCSSVANMIPMMSRQSNIDNGVSNELVASAKSDFADVEVKFCGPNLELKTLSSKISGQTSKIVSAIEDLSLEILQLSINIVEDDMLNAFTIKIGIDCKLSAEELAQQIQQTFC